jgi:hypothetical protein
MVIINSHEQGNLVFAKREISEALGRQPQFTDRHPFDNVENPPYFGIKGRIPTVSKVGSGNLSRDSGAGSVRHDEGNRRD